MKITDIIRGVLDLVDQAQDNNQEPAMAVQVDVAEPEVDVIPAELAVLQHLAGIDDPEYANEPDVVVSPVGAAFPGGDDMHYRKNPADIRSDSISMYPAYQATGR